MTILHTYHCKAPLTKPLSKDFGQQDMPKKIKLCSHNIVQDNVHHSL